MEYLVIVTGPTPSFRHITWLRNHGYSIVSSVFQLHILQGMELTPQVELWLKENNFEYHNIFAIEEEEILPPISEYVKPYMPGGKLGGIQLHKHLVDHPDVPVCILTTTDDRELVIRRVEKSVYIVFHNKEGFRYASMRTTDFLSKMKRGSGGSALSKCNRLLEDIERGYEQAYRYIPASEGYDFEYMVQRLNWNWRE